MMMVHGGKNWVLGANSSDWDSMADYMQEMMPYRFGEGSLLWQFHWILGLITWILIVVLLVALIRWVWKKGDKAR